MREQLRRFADFASMPPAALEVLAAGARRLRVPARRWLVRPGRVLAARVYLLEGRVRLVEAERAVIVNAGSARARRAVYPGAAGVATLAASVFLWVDPAGLDGPGPHPAGLGMPEVNAAESSWQRRFLTSPLMQRLEPAAWQRVLRAMSRTRRHAGEVIIRAGEPADCCYVLCTGSAEIRDAAGRVLADLAPGSLFGEDALVCGGVRNASVIMTCDGSVVSLAAERFQAWLLDRVVQPLASAGGRRLISLEPQQGASWIPLAGLREAGGLLSPRDAYAIVGGSQAERTLAAFLLAEQGIDARPLAVPAAVTPAPSAPGPTA